VQTKKGGAAAEMKYLVAQKEIHFLESDQQTAAKRKKEDYSNQLEELRELIQQAEARAIVASNERE